MIIVFEDNEGTTLSLHYEDNELYITVGGENEVDKRDNHMHIEDVDKLIAALKFLTSK
jgi:hypothetical protein